MSRSMTFGKYRGLPLSDVPTPYLRWIVREYVMRPLWLLPAVREEIEARSLASLRAGKKPTPPRKVRYGGRMSVNEMQDLAWRHFGLEPFENDSSGAIVYCPVKYVETIDESGSRTLRREKTTIPLDKAHFIGEVFRRLCPRDFLPPCDGHPARYLGPFRHGLLDVLLEYGMEFRVSDDGIVQIRIDPDRKIPDVVTDAFEANRKQVIDALLTRVLSMEC